ncbi:MAG: hypothetical protein J6K75_09865 [Erysipelotrichaceae bacterium]|nr:hypothetical protein [Erysipelotrichaceae bacterium]
MYKKQMILQRVVCYLVLVAAALVFIYSLGLMTDLYDNSLHYYAEDINNPMVAGSEVYYYMQGFNKNLTTAGIGLILLSLTQFVAQNHARRKYYVANYITVALNCIAAVGVSVWALINVFAYRAQYLMIDFETLKTYADLFGFSYTESIFWFDASVVVFGILLVVAGLNVYNLILKKKCMDSERKLLEGSGV